jgi:hypothetical protein
MPTHHDAPPAQRALGRARPEPYTSSAGPTSVDQAIQWIGAPTTPSGWKAIEAVGRLVITPDGRPIRSAITGRRVIVTGSYASAKTRRTHPHESMIELALFQESEVDVDVVDYRAQPFRFEFIGEDGPRIYIADCCRVLASGQVEVVEVKSDLRHLRDPDYAAKLEAIGLICEQIGWRLRTVTKTQLLGPKARRANTQLIQSRRMVGFTTQDVYAATAFIEESPQGQATLGGVSTALGDPRIGCARAMAMMVARILRIDLATPISGKSKISLVAPPDISARGAH